MPKNGGVIIYRIYFAL